MKRRWPALVVPLLLVALAPVLIPYLPRISAAIQQMGPWAPVAFALLYGSAVLTAIPCMPMALAAGAYFGSAVGVAAVYGGEMLGSLGCYAGGRLLGGESVRQWAAEHPKLKLLEPLLLKEGGLVVGMAHLVPFLPFNLINYGCGLLRVPFGSFCFWTALGVFPWTAMQVLGADLIAEAVRGGPVRGEIVALAVGLVVLIGVLLLLARRRLRR